MSAPKILIVDDDVDFSNELAEMLVAEGFGLEIINDAFVAYRQLLDKQYDLLLVDFKMPGINGVDLLKLVGKSKPLTKVIIISGRPFIEKIVEAENARDLVQGIFNKPFHYPALLEKIKTVLTETL